MIASWIMLSIVISLIVDSFVPIYMHLICISLSLSQWKCISQDLECFNCILLLIYPAVVELSVLIGVGGCRWPSDIRVWQIGMDNWALLNTPDVSASATEETTCQSVLIVTSIGAFLIEVSLFDR